MDFSFAILAFGLGALAAAAAGLAVLALWPRGAGAASGLLEAAAGGALLVLGLIHLGPEAVSYTAFAPILALIGLGAGALLHRGVRAAAGRGAAGVTLLAGLGLHSFVDGLTFAISLAAGAGFGLGATVGLLVHEAPKAVICLVLLRRAGLGPKAGAAGALFAAGGLTAIGAFLGGPLAGAATHAALGVLIALAAGLLIYAGLACLASVARTPTWPRILAAVLSALLVFALGHIHPAAHEPAIAPVETAP